MSNVYRRQKDEFFHISDHSFVWYNEKINMQFHQVEPFFLLSLVSFYILTCKGGSGFGNLTITKSLLIPLTSYLGLLLMVLAS